MGIPNKQIGWSQESNLLWQISKQLQNLIGVTFNSKTEVPISYYGQISKMTSATVPVIDQNVYQSTGVTGILDPLTSGISLGTADTFAVKNTSGETRVFQLFGSIDMAVPGVGDSIIGIKFALNGVEIDESECRAWAIGNRAAKLVTDWIIELQPNDEVALYIANFSNTLDFSFIRGRIVAQTV